VVDVGWRLKTHLASLACFDLAAWPHQFAKNYWSVSFAQRLYRLFGTMIEQKVVDWGG
jgi:hypothetical protein